MPPHNIEAEEAVLGAILLAPERAGDVVPLLRAGDFYRDAHREVFGAIAWLLEEGTPPDAVAVWDRLRSTGVQLPAGAAYLHTLARSTPLVANAPHYAAIVARHARARELLRAVTTAGRALLELEDPAAVLEGLTKALADIAAVLKERDP